MTLEEEFALRGFDAVCDEAFGEGGWRLVEPEPDARRGALPLPEQRRELEKLKAQLGFAA